MVALTGVEPADRQFSSVHVGLSGCRFSTVGIPGWPETPQRTADVVARSWRTWRPEGRRRGRRPLRNCRKLPIELPDAPPTGALRTISIDASLGRDHLGPSNNAKTLQSQRAGNCGGAKEHLSAQLVRSGEALLNLVQMGRDVRQLFHSTQLRACAADIGHERSELRVRV
jgi:hypothetical protein